MTSLRPALALPCFLLVLTASAVGCDDNGVNNEPPTLRPTLLYMETPSGGLGRITALNLDGTGRDVLTSGENAWAPGDVSPDGSVILFFGPTGPGTDQEILTMNYAGWGVKPVTDDPWQDIAASFLPDGRIIYGSNHGGQFDIYRIDADGSNVTQLTTDIGSEPDPSLSPDGTKIVFSRAVDIWVMNADGTGATNLTTFGAGEFGGYPRFSPDGSKIVFTYALNADRDLMIMDANGANRTNLTSSDPLFYGPACFSLDGQHIYVSAGTAWDAKRDIYRLDANGANRIQITDTEADEIFVRVVNLLR